MSRNKGHTFERKVAILFRRFFPQAKRGVQTRGGTAEAPDVDGTPWYIECKRMKRCNILGALRQAEEGSGANDLRPPLAVCRNDRDKAVVALYLEDFLKIVERLYGDK